MQKLSDFAANVTRGRVTPNLTYNDIPGTGNIKVLNYALAAEALEANLYVQAMQRLTTGGTNVLPATTTTAAQTITIPGLNTPTSEIDVQYLSTFTRIEREHRDFLNARLGTASIIGTGTNGILRNAAFDFGMQNLSRQEVNTLIYNVEATGVMAYLGAIPFFTDNAFLAIAGAIQGTEARHTATVAIILNILFNTRLDTAPLVGQPTSIYGDANTSGIDGTMTPDMVLAGVSPFIVLPGAAR